MVAALRRYGGGVADFAVRHDLDPQRVRYWIGRVEQGRRARPRLGRGEAVVFAPVRVIDSPAKAAPAQVLEVVVGAAVVRVGGDFDETHLRRVVAALGGVAC